MSPKEDALRFRVYKFYEDHIFHGKPFTVRHFMEEGVPRRTVYNILDRFSKGLAPERHTGSGRKAKKLTKGQLKRLSKMFENKSGISQRIAARKLNVSQPLVHRALKMKLAIKYRKKQKIPARNRNQIQLAKTKCGRLLRKFSDREFVLDDESYFTLSHSSINGNDGFYSSDPQNAPTNLKFMPTAKFENKVLVWIAVSPKGLSKPLIRNSGYAINAQRYLDECIRRRLIPYIRSNYANGEYIFWPDQASSHYANIVLGHLREENIDFVKKEDNPANVPEVRCIEDFWSYLKSLVYANGWKAENIDQLKRRIKNCLKKIKIEVVQKLALSTKKRIDHVRRHGVVESR